jgi:hypothetical protein
MNVGPFCTEFWGGLQGVRRYIEEPVSCRLHVKWLIETHITGADLRTGRRRHGRHGIMEHA